MGRKFTIKTNGRQTSTLSNGTLSYNDFDYCFHVEGMLLYYLSQFFNENKLTLYYDYTPILSSLNDAESKVSYALRKTNGKYRMYVPDKTQNSENGILFLTDKLTYILDNVNSIDISFFDNITGNIAVGTIADKNHYGTGESYIASMNSGYTSRLDISEIYFSDMIIDKTNQNSAYYIYSDNLQAYNIPLTEFCRLQPYLTPSESGTVIFGVLVGIIHGIIRNAICEMNDENYIILMQKLGNVVENFLKRENLANRVVYEDL